MAIEYKVLGQSAPAAAANTDLYTVPTGRQVVSSTIAIANRSQGEVKFRIAIRVAGEAISSKQYIAYNTPVAGQDSTFITVGVTLSSSDIVTVYAENDQLSFNMFGSEVTA